MTLKVGDQIQHVSGTGPVFVVVLDRQEHGDFVAVTEDVDPKVTRTINQGNWKLYLCGGLDSHEK